MKNATATYTPTTYTLRGPDACLMGAAPDMLKALRIVITEADIAHGKLSAKTINMVSRAIQIATIGD